MKVKLLIPESLEDITVEQFQQIDAILKETDSDDLDTKLLKAILNFDNVDAISVKDRNNLIKSINLALEKKGEFKQTFVLNGVEYGLIPNFDKITNGEYIDLIKYNEDIQDLHRFLAVAYRPLKFKDRFDNYKILTYKGTSEYADKMKELPMSIAKGVQGFFLTLANHLESHTPRFIVEELRKA